MSEAEILKKMKAGQYDPVYFLTGEEPYFIDLISDYIEQNALVESEKDFNQTIFYGGDSTMDVILSAAKRFPMMAEKQVVIVKEAQELKEWKNEDRIMPLVTYLNNPQSSTILVFQHKHKKLDGRSKVAKILKKNSTYFEGKKIYENRIPDWIANYVKAKKRSIDPKTGELLAEYLGNDLGKVVNALDKLLILVKEDEQITSLHVEKNIGISKDYNVFEFQRALAKKDVLKANEIITYFSANPKNNPIARILPNLYTFFTRVIKLHRIPPGGNPNTVLGVSPYAMNDYTTAKRHYSAGALARVITHLRKADTMSKGVDNPSVGSQDILKELTYKILHDPK